MTTRADCLSDDELLDWIEGRLPADLHAAFQTHIDGCNECRLLVGDAARVAWVDGGTLTRWLAQRSRSLDEVLAIFIAERQAAEVESFIRRRER
jgi:hypothetical protein